MIEVYLYNLYSHFVIQAIFLIVLLIIFFCLLFFVCSMDDNTVLIKKERFVIKVQTVIATISLFGDFCLFMKYDHNPYYGNTNYYQVKNVALKRYSLETNQFVTTNGKAIDNAKVTTQASIYINSPQVELKEYKLKSKYQGIHKAPKIIYTANVKRPAKEIHKVEKGK